MPFGVRFRESLPPAVTDELDALVARLRAVLFREHNADGTHIDPEWQNYQPTLRDATLGDGRLRGRYLRQGNIVFYDIFFSHGNTTALTSSPISLTLPIPGNTVITPLPWIVDRTVIGQALGFVASGDYIGVAMASGETVTVRSDAGDWTSAVPATWVAGDTLKLSGFYVVDPDAAPIGDV
jgi:hypothetical protein